MIAVHDDDGSRASAVGGVDEPAAVTRLLDDALDRRRFAETMLPKPILMSLMSMLSPHSMFCTCSRSFSTSLLISTTIFAACVKFALAPIVFVSRLIS